jgi:hypothetical protein
MEHFDERIKQSLEGLEMPYDAGAWQQMTQRLDAAAPAAPGTGLRNWAIGLGGVAVVAGTVWFGMQTDAPVAPTENQVAVIETETTDDVEVMSGQEVAASAERPAASANLTTENQVVASQMAVNPEIDNTATASVEAKDTEAAPSADIRPEVNRQETAQPSGPRPVRGDVDEEITPIFEVNKTRLCAGEELVLINETAIKGRATQFHWEFGDGASSDAREPRHVYERPGRYTLSLEAGRKGTTTTQEIEVAPAPDAAMDRENLIGPAVPYFRLSTTLNTGETAHWTFGDGGTATGEEVTRLFRSTADAKVTLTVRNQHGCAVKQEAKDLYSGSFNLLAANAFSPTETSGTNDSYMPESLRELNVPFTFVVVDMKGQTVFTSKDVNNPWTGRTLTGEVLPRGPYKWQVTLGADVVRNKVFTGQVILK